MKLTTRFGALIAVVAVLVAGCDMLSQQQGSDALLKVTNDLGERMTVFNSKTAPALSSKSEPPAKFTLEVVSRIDPPNNGQSASHLSASGGPKSGDIFVGYKVPGSTFGGGVDILNKNDPTHLTSEDNALLTTDLDVQEVAYDPSGSAPFNLYIAGAVDFGNIPARDYGNTPAVMVRAQIDGNGNVEENSDSDVLATEVAMPDNLVKSVTLATSSDNTHDVYAVTDGASFFEFDSDLGNRREVNSNSSPNPDAIGSSVGFSSVASFDGNNFAKALTQSGEIYQFGVAGNKLGEITKRPISLGSLQSNGIARMTTHDHSVGGNSNVNENLLYVALNTGGMVVLNKKGNTKHFEKTDQYYVSVTAEDGRVYAAGPGGTIDVFSVTDALSDPISTDPGGLSLEGSFDLGGLEEVGAGPGSVGSAQINQILAEGGYLYVAASDEGVVVLEIAENQGNIF